LKTELFIAKRIIKGGASDSMSGPIIKIAIWGVMLGIAVMIISVGIVTGFQNQIRDKIIGFGGHLRIESFKTSGTMESIPLEINQDFYPDITQVPGIKHIQTYALKSGIVETGENIQGVLIKGVGADFDWSFFDGKILDGERLNIERSEEPSNDILLSNFIAKRLYLEVGDRITVYMIQDGEDIRPRRFNVKGIYETGLEELDKKVLFVDIAHIQNINKWGIETYLVVEDTCINGRTRLTTRTFGGSGKYRYEWEFGNPISNSTHLVCLTGDTVIQVIASDNKNTLPDTAWVTFKTKEMLQSDLLTGCLCVNNFDYKLTTSGGSGKYYVGGFEVLIESFDDLDKLNEIVYYGIDDLETRTIKEDYGEIFAWLEMLDVNVVIIIVLMVFVALINMSSALLILILERVNMIGILKAIGATNKSIRKVFLYNAAYILVKGMIYGNILGLTLGYIQHHFKLIKLPQENYYVSEVPVNIDWNHVLFLNLGTVAVCLVVLILPTILVTRITPVKAIKFD
jgi:lipoprotein-releasing system permease protein